MANRKVSGSIARRDGTQQPLGDIQEASINVVTRDTSHIEDMGSVAFAPVGECIYCGAKDSLSGEHVIPFGLSGTVVLPAASCQACSKITSQFELKVLRGPMRPVRVLRRLRSRSKHDRAPGSAELSIVRNGVEETVRISLNKYPILLPFPLFPPPSYMTGEHAPGIKVRGVHTVLFGPHPDEVARTLGAGEISITPASQEPVAFARMLAKIAYSYAWGQGALLKIQGRSPVVASILGETDEIGRWVGTIEGPTEQYPNLLHRVQLVEQNGLLIVGVHLFADSCTPFYGVILGELRPLQRDGNVLLSAVFSGWRWVKASLTKLLTSIQAKSLP